MSDLTDIQRIEAIRKRAAASGGRDFGLVSLEDIDWLTDQTDRASRALNLILEYGYIDGAHHKQWLLDQALRVLLTEDEYQSLCGDDWDTGIAP